jgi:hypothetical protein
METLVTVFIIGLVLLLLYALTRQRDNVGLFGTGGGCPGGSFDGGSGSCSGGGDGGGGACGSGS